MNTNAKLLLALVLACATCAGIVLYAGCSAGQQDSAAVAEALTDRLNIPAGKEVSGPEPTEHLQSTSYSKFVSLAADDLTYPQIVSVTGTTAELSVGQEFNIALHTNYLTPLEITGAVMAVEYNGVYAGSYIDVTVEPEPVEKETIVRIIGSLQSGLPFGNEPFDIKMAIKNSNGIGNYYTWSVTVHGDNGGADGGRSATDASIRACTTPSECPANQDCIDFMCVARKSDAGTDGL